MGFSLLGALGTIRNVAGTIGTVANTVGALGNAFGTWGQVGQSQSQGGSTQQGGGSSQSMSKSGTNVDQVEKWLQGAYGYQNNEGVKQNQFNQRSMLQQMGYNTLGAIMQGVYNHIENSVAMNFNSTEAMKNREWQEHMSNTPFPYAIEFQLFASAAATPVHVAPSSVEYITRLVPVPATATNRPFP